MISRLGVVAAALIAAIVAAPDCVVAQCVVGTNAALTFDGGNDVATLPNSPVLDGFADFTFEFWFRTSNASPQFMVAMVKRETAAVGRPYWFGFSSGRLDLRLNFGAAVLTGTQVVANGVWHHAAATRTGAAIVLYVDGLVYLTGTYGGFVNAAASNLELGGEHNSQGLGFSFFQGSLDEVRIWNTARTQSQLQATMNVGLLGNELGLVGYWRLDEGSGQQTVFNSSLANGSSLDGTLGASPLVASDDPTRITTALPPLPYCAPCPTPPCGQANSACASLTVNGVGANAQGPFDVVVPLGGTITFTWSGPAQQPLILVATSNLIPGQTVPPGPLVVDVNVANFVVLFSGYDPVWGPLFVTNNTGTSVQSFGVPTPSPGITLYVQGLIYDSGFTCSGGFGFMSTASFAIQL